MPMRWRKGKSTGRFRGAKTHELWLNGKQLATAQSHMIDGCELWFWYGDGKNTSHIMMDLPTAKADAISHFKNRAYPIK